MYLALSVAPVDALDLPDSLLPDDKQVPHHIVHRPEEPPEMFEDQ